MTARQQRRRAASQLDYAFASRGFHQCINVQALNETKEWGRATTVAC